MQIGLDIGGVGYPPGTTEADWKGFEFRRARKGEVFLSNNGWEERSFPSECCYPVAIPTNKPKKVRVKAWLVQDGSGAVHVDFCRPVCVRGNWNIFHSLGNCNVSDPSLPPGGCKVVEVEVDAVAPEL